VDTEKLLIVFELIFDEIARNCREIRKIYEKMKDFKGEKLWKKLNCVYKKSSVN
jgi:hypothetical protein